MFAKSIDREVRDMLLSEDIANKRFDRAALGGYKTEEVDRFMVDVANDYAELEEKNEVLTKKLEVLAEKLEEYRSDEESLRAALLGAQKLGDSVIRESRSKADIIIKEANIKAERIVANAGTQVERERLLLEKMQKDVAAFKSKLIAIYKQHLELISALPGETKAAPQRTQAVAPPKEEEPQEESRQGAPVAEQEQEPQPKPAYEEAQTEQAAEPVKQEEPVQEEPAKEKEPEKEDEYYEDFGEDEEDNPPAAPRQKSGRIKMNFKDNMKFGDAYKLNRD